MAAIKSPKRFAPQNNVGVIQESQGSQKGEACIKRTWLLTGET